MATKTIPALPAAATLTGSEPIETVQGGDSVRTTAQLIANLAPPGPTLPLAVAQGGTGETTAQAAIDALFASVTKGNWWLGDGTNITPLAVGPDGDIPYADSSQPQGVRWDSAPVTSIAVGDLITGAGHREVVFADSTGLLQTDAGLTYVGGGALTVTTSAASAHLCGGSHSSTQFIQGAIQAVLCNTGFAGQFVGPSQTIVIAGTGVAITYTAAVPANWAASTPPTDVWVALDRIAAWIAANSTQLATIGITTLP